MFFSHNVCFKLSKRTHEFISKIGLKSRSSISRILIWQISFVSNVRNQLNETMFHLEVYSLSSGVCSTANVPSVSSINRILRNRAAERAAVEYTKIASRSMLQLYPQLWSLHESRHLIQPRDFVRARDPMCSIQLPEIPSLKEQKQCSGSQSPVSGMIFKF